MERMQPAQRCVGTLYQTNSLCLLPDAEEEFQRLCCTSTWALGLHTTSEATKIVLAGTNFNHIA